MIATENDAYEGIVSQKSTAQWHGLIDECLDEKIIIPGVHGVLGKSTHARFEGLEGCGDGTGIGDLPLYEWTVNNNIDYVISLDAKGINGKGGNPKKDLGAIIVDQAYKAIEKISDKGADIINVDELPVFIFVKLRKTKQGQNSSQEALRLIRKHADKIKSYIETRTAPFIEVKEKGVSVHKTYTEIYADHLMKKGLEEQGDGVLARKKQWIFEWMSEIIKKIPEEEKTLERLRQVEDMVRASAAICAMEVTPSIERGKTGVFLKAYGAVLP
jgi:hypothetical protein